MIQFYAPEILKEPHLGPEEALHCMRVLRKRVGDTILVTDGKGQRYECEILKGDTRRVDLRILSTEEIPLSWDFNITLVIAPTKNADRMAWLVEKATEIGVNSIKFVKCRNSERKQINIERLKRNAVSAMNQSLKTFLPQLEELKDIDSIPDFVGQKYFGYCNAEIERKTFVKEYSGGDVIILIGPEGDFSPEEVDNLQGSGFEAVTFGAERLRTETAALYGVTAIHVINDRII